MKKGFLEELEHSKTLKIKFKGKMYPVPPPIFRQAKKFALESVGIDYDVFKSNPTSEKAKEKQIKKAFESFLESYLEAIVPDTKGNPTAKKIQAAFRVMDQLTNVDRTDGLIARWFPNKSAVEKHELSRVLKGAIMVITHIFTEGNAKILRKDYGFKEDAPDFDQQKVHYNRLVRAATGFMVMSLISKLYSMNAKDLEVLLKNAVPQNELAEFWRDEKKSDMYFRELKNRMTAVLGKIDLLDAFKG